MTQNPKRFNLEIGNIGVSWRILTPDEIRRDYENPDVTERWQSGHHVVAIWNNRQLYFDGLRLH